MIHLVIGPVGAGKSTYAAQLAAANEAVWLNLDSWMATLYGADPRPEDGRMNWYLERVQRCVSQIWDVAERLVAVGTVVVLELGLIQRAPRHAFYQKLDGAEYAHVVHVVDAPREIRRQRVARRNSEKGATFSMHVPTAVFEFASDLWEPPDIHETAARSMRFING